MVRLAALAALLSLAFTSASAPTVSGERPVSEPIPGSAAPSAQFQQKVAFDGTNYLVVWTDARRGSEIYGARVSRSGAVLDPSGVLVSSGDLDVVAQSPSVAFDGTEFLVVWTSRDFSTGINTLRASRVKRSGVVLDRPARAIATVAGEPEPALAFDGTNYLVVWNENRSGPSEDIFGARVNRSGDVLGGSPFAVSQAARDQESPNLAFDGTDFLVVWTDYRNDTHGDRIDADVYGARVSRAGGVLDGTGIAVSRHASTQFAPAVAYGGSTFLVVWADRRSGAADIYGTRVSRLGVVSNSAGVPIDTATNEQLGPSVAFDGTNFLVVWTDLRPSTGGLDLADVFATRVTPAGTVLQPNGFDISSGTGLADPYHATALGFDGVRFLALWTKPNISDVAGARVPKTGTVPTDASALLVSQAAGEQFSPAVAFDGTNHFVVWTDARSATRVDIYGARVSPTGEMLDGRGIAISTAANSQSSPAVAFDGTNYLVVWTDSRNDRISSDIYGARVSKAGAVRDPSGFAISTAPRIQAEPAVAFDGTNYLVAWTDLRNDTDPELDNQDVYGARVSRAGMVIDPSGRPLSTAVEDQSKPALAFDGTNYLAVWMDRPGGSDHRIVGSRVSPSAAVLDPPGIVISTAGEAQHPAVAFDGTNHLVVWDSSRGTASGTDVVGARVSKAGVVRTPGVFAISEGPGTQRLPRVAYRGSFLVVWRDDRRGFADVFGNRVTSAGAPVDGAGFSIARAEALGDVHAAAVTGGPSGDGRFVVAYERFAVQSPYGTSRVFLRTSPK